MTTSVSQGGSNFPPLSNFNPNTEAFETYVLRFEFFFTAECIDVKLKAAKFLSAIDGKSFTLALNLLHSKRLQDASPQANPAGRNTYRWFVCCSGQSVSHRNFLGKKTE